MSIPSLHISTWQAPSLQSLTALGLPQWVQTVDLWNCNCNWDTCIAPPTRRHSTHHRVSPYPGARRQNETDMFSDHDETSPSIAAVSTPSVSCSMLAVQQHKGSVANSSTCTQHDKVATRWSAQCRSTWNIGNWCQKVWDIWWHWVFVCVKHGAAPAFRQRRTEESLFTSAIPQHCQAARRQTTFTVWVKVATFDPAKVAESFCQLTIQFFLCAFKTYVQTFVMVKNICWHGSVESWAYLGTAWMVCSPCISSVYHSGAVEISTT